MFIGVSGGFGLLYMSVSVCATRVRGALRVTRGVRCGVKNAKGETVTWIENAGIRDIEAVQAAMEKMKVGA